MAVAIAFKLLPAMSASECVVRFSLHTFRVRVPPCRPALRAAELLLFPSGELDQRFAAVQAKLRGNLRKAVALCLLTGEAVGSTI